MNNKMSTGNKPFSRENVYKDLTYISNGKFVIPLIKSNFKNGS